VHNDLRPALGKPRRVADNIADVAAALALLARRIARGSGKGVSMNVSCPVIVMAKAPVAGCAKTRLIPALGPAGAAALAERLLARTVEHALAAQLGAVDLCCAPDCSHPAFTRHAGCAGVALSEQGSGDLGARMVRAMDRWLAQCERVLLIGTDAPGLVASVLQRAARALDSADVVFVPAFDGGYALVGLRRPQPQLFDDMIWSTPTVMARTRVRIAASGLTHVELAPLPDVDVPADLIHLPPEWRS
jgi:uncharacterized protein